MTFDLQKVLESKRAYRARLAARPIGEKLRMLDALRERHVAIRGNKNASELSLREESDAYGERKE